MGKLITGWWDELGLDIQYSVEDNGVLIDGGYNYAGDTYKPDYDIYIWAWQPSGSDPGRRLGYFRTVQIENQNDACWSSKTYDDLWEQQSRSSTRRSASTSPTRCSRCCTRRAPTSS